MTRFLGVLERLLLLAAAGLAAYLGLIWAYRREGPVRDVVVRLLGPPPRQPEELYEPRPGGPSVDHSLWDELLRAHVDEDGRVDYGAFGEDRERLDRYLGVLAEAPFGELGRDEKLALLANAYNAFTVKLVTEHLPLDSIRDVPAEKRWQDRRWQLGGRAWSLAELEHDEIRARFVEPRIHFALVCGAAGCPPLVREAYVAERLEAQLESRARYVHEHEAWFRFDEEANLVHLTEIYSWYRGDFEQVAGSVTEYAARYAPRLRRALEVDREPGVRWIPYDWRLNSAPR